MLTGVVPLQVSTVQVVPSSLMSIGSATGTMLPMLSHWLRWQSPAGPDTTVPIGVLTTPQMPAALQARVWHSVSLPGHWLAVLHCTQTEPPAMPLHREPPFWLQGVSAASGGFDG